MTMFHHVMISLYLLPTLLVLLLSTVHCDKSPHDHDDTDGVNLVTQNGTTVSNASSPLSNFGRKSIETSTREVSQPSGVAPTVIQNDQIEISSQPSITLRDDTEYDFTTGAYTLKQNVANVDDRITTKYNIPVGLEKNEKLDDANSQIPLFPPTTPTSINACDTDQVEVTSNPVQINAFTNRTRCSLLVTAPNTSTAISVKLRKSDLHNVTTYFYMERLGNLPSNCSDRFVLVSVDHFPCVVVIGGNEFMFHIQNAEITLEIVNLDIQILPCLDTESPVLASKQCNSTSYITKMEQNVEHFTFVYRRYYKFIYYIYYIGLYYIWDTLNVNVTRHIFECKCYSCRNTLGYREWLSMCIDGKDNNATTRLDLIVYQPNMKGLSFAYTGLHTIQPNAFLELEDLEVLILEHNSLSILPPALCRNLPHLRVINLGYNTLKNLTTDLFKGQCEQNLLRIDLNNNKLIYLANDLFNSTSKLRYLDMSQNMLVHVSSGTFSKLTLLEELNLSRNHISSLTKGVFDLPHGLWTLKMSDNNIASLPAGMFNSLGRLRYLDLSDNNIASLPAGVFDSLGGLRYLDLSDNNIASLPAGVFDSLGGLRYLNLSDNNIASLPAGVFDSLGRLRYLDLSDNNIASLPAGVFDSLGGLRYFNLSDNNIPSLPDGLLDSLGLLFTLDLSDNHIASLPAGVFCSLRWLEYLDLRDNNIASLPAGVFDSLGGLEFRNLSDNNIASLPAGVFGSLRWLEYLDLRDNNIASPPAGMFDSLSELRYFDLSDNKITSLPAGVFGSLRGLTYLDLSDNNIPSLPAGVFDLQGSLKTLDLNDNYLTDLPLAIFNSLRDLLTLDLSKNYLAALPLNVFDSFNSLLTLDLSDNDLFVLPSDILKTLHKLILLNLPCNNLTINAAQTFESLNTLQVLNLRKNRIAKFLPRLLWSTTNLLSLDISENSLQSLPDNCLANLSRLIYLNVSHNSLDKLPSFSEQSRLEVLDLSTNRFNRLKKGAFYYLKSLIYLSLDKNDLLALTGQIFYHLNNLRFLNVSYNAIQTIDTMVFSNKSNLQTIDLRQNKINKATYDSFKTPQNAIFLVDKYATCCFMSETQCVSINSRPEYLTCNRMLRNVFLRISVWILGLSAFICNGIAFYTRISTRGGKRQVNDSYKVQTLLISHLALSDLLMGINMLLLASADVYYGGYFPSYAQEWRQSFACKFAGFLSIFSSEASVFFVTMISIDRLLRVKYSFSDFQLTPRVARICVAVAWLIAFLISVTPIALVTDRGDIFNLSEVCIGIPIVKRRLTTFVKEQVQINVTSISTSVIYNSTIFSTLDLPYYKQVSGFEVGQLQTVQNITYNIADITGSEIAPILSIVVFIAVNLTCFIIVAVCYIQVFVFAKRKILKLDRDKEIRMSIRMFAIVFTDFCCWGPLCLICILAQGGVIEISPEMYAWTAGFILPINSSINPFLYVLHETISDYFNKRQKKRNTREKVEQIEMQVR